MRTAITVIVTPAAMTVRAAIRDLVPGVPRNAMMPKVTATSFS
jgi:hypothetical protein